MNGEVMAGEWEQRLERWRAELQLAAALDEARWVPLDRAEAETGVSRSALRSWYRSGQIRTRLVDGPHGPQRLVSLEDVTSRAAQSPRIRRKAEAETSVEAQLTLLRHHVAQLEIRMAAMERLVQPTTPDSPS